MSVGDNIVGVAVDGMINEVGVDTHPARIPIRTKQANLSRYLTKVRPPILASGKSLRMCQIFLHLAKYARLSPKIFPRL
jgi:hypothetical protein